MNLELFFRPTAWTKEGADSIANATSTKEVHNARDRRC